ncbi:unnamed protein product [Clonostachys rosea]|uniref:Extracellular membrane protein CFEM domain-containing protein n=1 Tax=Bionectria ochroleuca TaxID=29856 RepID=A0ABY6U220_BIOOC|nr:unnamed protein product [Clonostachys rosea]
MKFTLAFLLALPAMSLAQPVAADEPSTTFAIATPTATPDLSVCEEQAGGYSSYCARCEHICAGETGDVYAICFLSVFSAVNYNDAQCWQRGGNDCANKAVDKICGDSSSLALVK